MSNGTSSVIHIAAALGDAWGAVEAVLSGNLGAVLGITYSEYRLLAALGENGTAGASRVQVANAIGLTPSAVTRALRPLADLGYVENESHPRDARMTIAKLTSAGGELLTNAEGLLDDVALDLADRLPGVTKKQDQLLDQLRQLSSLSGRVS